MVTMTDKQIIIDDQNKIINILEQECTEKMDIIVALENKLKAKEQECEELKEQLKEMNEVIRTETTRCSLVNSLKTDLDQLKAENDTLNFECDTLDFNNRFLQARVDKLEQVILRRNDQIDQLKAENKHLNNLLNQALKELEKTRETLTEIKELCQKHIKAEKIVMANDILQKISECEVE
jgi:chromosome segregation ATPase